MITKNKYKKVYYATKLKNTELDKYVKKSKITQLRRIIREESYNGSLSAHLRLMGYDQELIKDNVVCERLADDKNTTPMTHKDKKWENTKRVTKILLVLAAYRLVGTYLGNTPLANYLEEYETIKMIAEVFLF